MPYVSVWVDGPDLTEADTEDLLQELERRGHCAPPVEGIERIQHLMDCGMCQYAQEEALRIVADQIGRPGAWARKALS